MVNELWQYHLKTVINRPYTLEEMFAYSVRFQILCENQEEKDYLYAMQLMFGREVQVDILSEWNCHKFLLPIVFATHPFDLSKLP